MNIDWKLFKRTYPYICDECGYLHWDYRTICEGCGSKNTLRKISKKDWKKVVKLDKIKVERSLLETL